MVLYNMWKMRGIIASFWLLAVGLCLLTACSSQPVDVRLVDQQPTIYPDYKDVTIPVEIAPLNFDVVGEGIDRVDV